MYREGKRYNEMTKLVIDIYLDYNINGFPVDAEEVCCKLGIKLIPYSKYRYEEQKLLKKKSLFGFYVPPAGNKQPMIFYNDNISEAGSLGNIRRNIFHEVKHYICGDIEENPEDDDLADYFGKYFLAPIPYLIYKGIEDVNQIIADFGIDYEMASYILKNITNRKNKYGNEIFDYERPMLRHLLGDRYTNSKGGDVN